MTDSNPASLVVAPDLLALERALLKRVEAEDARARTDLARLGRPAWVVVPSKSLAAHLRRRLVAEGATRLGWRVATLFELAQEVLYTTGFRAPGGELTRELTLRRAARNQPALAPLATTDEGLDLLSATVRDILDVGFDGEQEPAWRDAALEATEPARTTAIIEVALAVRDALDAEGRIDQAGHLRVAADLLADDVELLPARAIFIHGFADVTFGSSQMLRALARHDAACLFLERPRILAERASSRFLERFAHLAEDEFGKPLVLDGNDAGRSFTRFIATSKAQECDSVAGEILRLVGNQPELALEDVAIVVRDPKPWLSSLERGLDRAGLPFSSVGIRREARGHVERLDAVVQIVFDADRVKLSRLARAVELDPLHLFAFQFAGAVRARDVAKIDWKLHASQDSADTVSLPTTTPSASGRLTRRRVAIADLEQTASRLTTLVERAQDLDSEASWAEHAARLTRFTRDGVGWASDDPTFQLLVRVLERASGELDVDTPLRFREFARALARLFEKEAELPFGGAGGGVQILTATEARGRTFEHLFYLGLVRGEVPHAVSEDPLLPDDARHLFASLAPEFPIKGRSADESYHQFASLVGGARNVHLSWFQLDENGREKGPSPCVVRLLDEHAAPTRSAPDDFASDPLVALGVAGELEGWTRGFAQETSPEEARHLAQVVEFWNASRFDVSLDPFDGLIGPRPAPERLYITTLEKWHECPWRMFLAKTLGLEPRPEPEKDLPSISPRELGNVVHEALERAGDVPTQRTGHGPTLVADADRNPSPFDRALHEARLADALGEVALESARRANVEWPGYTSAVRRLATKYLEFALPSLGRPVLSETDCSFEVDADTWKNVTLRFRIDRIEVIDGNLLLTDFKTGKSLERGNKIPKKSPRTALRAAIRLGDKLQIAAYVHGFEESGTGRYLYLSPDLDEHAQAARSIEFEPDDDALLADFHRAVQAALNGMSSGTHTQRLRQRVEKRKQGPDVTRLETNHHCDRCDFREACSIGDSARALKYEALIEDGAPGAPGWTDAMDPFRA